jgi:uracil-DNA glycosylase
MTLEEFFGGWMQVIDKRELLKVMSVIELEYKKSIICPDQSNIFRAFKLCPYKELKVIMLGQDPYPQRNVATGILFGNKKEKIELSPSLQIIQEACINYEVPHGIIDFDVTLESWATQGVLMLNSALTCILGQVGSHTMLWRPFVSSLLKNLSNNNPGMVYVLFGSQAQTFLPYINKKVNDIITVEHPAWFARTNRKMPYHVFSDINNLIKGKYGISIEWYKEY